MGPLDEVIQDHEVDTWKKIPEGSLEVGFHELSGYGEGVEERYGRESVGAFDTGGDTGDVFWEGE